MLPEQSGPVSRFLHCLPFGNLCFLSSRAIPLPRPDTLGAEKKSGVPYILTSHVGIAKRPS
jgi:hypothetical protein